MGALGGHPGAGAQWSGRNVENRRDHVKQELTAKARAFF